jgi:hypothetical protein
MNRLVAFLVVAALAVLIIPTVARTAPTAPTGLSSISLDGKVGLSWKTVSGATSYKVYRGASATSITTLVGTSSTATYTDSTVANGTSYFYAVKASASSGDSPSSSPTLVKPLAKSCSTGSVVVQENCYPGSTSWRADAAGPVSSSSTNIEGFATATSVNQGGSVDVKVNTADNAPYRIEIYRMGYYGGAHARLVSTIPNLTGVDQDACQTGSGNTGLLDCSNWATSATITTSTSWPTGVYMMRLVRTDTGNDNNVLLVVRNDSSNSDVLYTVPTSTYQAYNNYGGKSLYDFNSSGDTTVAATARAVKVSYDRPYSETYTTDPNWFGYQDVASVGFLENNGYDVSYATSTDLHTTGASLLSSHKSFVSPTHDEYWSSEMRNAVTTARNAGTGLFWMGSNQVYWKIRFETNPFSSVANRVEVCYKSTASGATDPVSPTGTWRDPAGANAPENALLGQMYIGDNDQNMFKLGVSDTQGKNRIWRHTDMTSLPAGTSTTLGQKLVGWEWNDRVANGQEPANTQVWTSSAVNGELVQHNGRDYITGAVATASGTAYQAASGAWVVSTGTNYWTRGLDLDGGGSGEPNNIVQQATVNILSDMNSRPTTPMAGLQVDAAGAPTVSSRTPGPGDTGVPTDSDLSVTFNSSLDANSVNSSTFTLTTAGGSAVPATVSYNDATKTVTLNPTNPLGANASYTAKLKGGAGGISGWGGSLAADVTWSFTTGAGTPPVVLSTTPNDGDGSVSVATTVKAVFDRDMTASTITSSSFTLTPQAGNAVAATVTYNAATDTATLTPTAALDPSRQYTATLTTAVKGGDGTALAAAKTWTFTTADALTITTKVPAPLATGVSPGAIARAVFSRAVDPTTLTSSTFTLTPSGGSAISASVTYDATTNTASLTPSAALTLNKVYTVKVAGTVKAADGSALGADVTWTFTTATSAPTAPTVVATSPVASATAVATDSAVTATFDRAMDATSITASSFVLKNPSNVALAATVSYDAASQTARLVPTAALPSGTVLTATLTTAVRSSVGTPMAATKTWTFTTADCPCSMMGSMTPASTNLDVADGRGGSGLTYEMGTKFTVTKTMKLTAVRFYKDANETGTHVGRIWNSAGTQVASVTFVGETASGWQKGVLSSPLTLTANVTYTVSVGFNSRFTMTEGGLASSLVNGPLASVADGADGVIANSAGTFPTLSWHTSNYFVDAIVANPGTSNAPVLSSRTPVSGATGVDNATTVTATFAASLDPATVTSTTFSLATAGGTAVPASVTYNDTTKTATLTPTNPLSGATSYTAKLTTGIHSDDGTPLAAQTTWSFSTAAPSTVPSVTSTSPAASATGVSTTLPVQATFSTSLDPSTVNGTTFSLTTAGGATVPATVGYDDVTKTATLTPSAALTGGATYTATITTGIKSSTSTPMAATKTWSFTTSGCPCSTMNDLTPQYTGLDVRDGRGGSGPWTYELGSKFTVSSAASLTGIRFYKDANETGTHVGTLWNAAGGIVGQVTFGSETASGWQQANFTAPIAMTPGAVYTVSVGFNTRFVMTSYGLRYALTSGPLSSVADGQNGVYGLSAGTFPTGSWASSNYLVDAVVQ